MSPDTALAARHQVLAMGVEALAKVEGHADLAAAGLLKGALIEVRPLLCRSFKPGVQGRGPGQGDTHDPSPDAYACTSKG
jgi:hypothetical protein